jgi:hypothetical protein
MNDRPRALAVLISIFVAGCIIGAIGFFLWAKKMPQAPPFRGNPSGFPSARGGPERPRLPQILQLTPEQTTRFREIMEESRHQIEALWIDQEPKIEAIRSETNRKLSKILNEEQKKKYDGFLKEMDQWRGRGPRRERGFGPPGPPPPQKPEPGSDQRK